MCLCIWIKDQSGRAVLFYFLYNIVILWVAVVCQRGIRSVSIRGLSYVGVHLHHRLIGSFPYCSLEDLWGFSLLQTLSLKHNDFGAINGYRGHFLF